MRVAKKSKDCFMITCSLLEAELIRCGLYKVSKDRNLCLKAERQKALEAFETIDKLLEKE